MKIEYSDPKAQVNVKVDGGVIDPADLKEPLRLPVGTHNLLVTSHRYESVSKSILVRQGIQDIVPVTLKDRRGPNRRSQGEPTIQGRPTPTRSVGEECERPKDPRTARRRLARRNLKRQ